VSVKAYGAEGYSGEILRDGSALQKAYRSAASLLHPDQGGNHEEFVRLQQAMEVLKGARQ